MADIYFLRHGQTDMNITHMLQGRTNTDLNDRGRRQARSAGKALQRDGIVPDIIFASPLNRVRETTEEALSVQGLEPIDMTVGEALVYQGEKIPRVTDQRLIEMSFGEVEGIPMSELPDDFAGIFFDDPANYEPVPGAESYHELLKRCRSFIEYLRENTRPGGKLADKTIVCATHGGVLHGILLLLWHRDLEDFWKQQVLNCAIVKAELADRQEDDTAEFIEDGFTGEEKM